jgi:hypothetical protein
MIVDMMKMNISVTDSQLICEAKICRCIDNKKIVYGFSEPVHGLCIDRKQLVISQIQACRNLLSYTTDKSEFLMIQKEIDELKTFC